MKTILLIEDDQALALAVTENLVAAGFNVLRAADGKTGLSMALEKKPDLVLINILLPIMDGMTILKNLRQDEWGKNVPAIILTNLSSPTTIAKAVEYMSDREEYMVKTDWKIEDLVAKVKAKLM